MYLLLNYFTSTLDKEKQSFERYRCMAKIVAL